MSVYDTQPWLSLYDPEFARTENLGDGTALGMFTAFALADPTFPLVSYFDTTLSSGEVEDASDALATVLQERGVTVGDRVCLYMQNIPEFIIGLLAAWKIGAIVVPANPMWRQREMELVLQDSGATTLILLEQLWHDVAKDVLANSQVSTVITCSPFYYLRGTRPRIMETVESTPVVDALRYEDIHTTHKGRTPVRYKGTPEDTVLLCYTSGTTGPPKGAMISNSNIVYNSEQYRAWRYLSSDDCLYAIAPLFHITGLIGHITVSLLAPMRIVLSYRFDVETALELIEKYKVTFTVGAITVFIAMLNDPTRAQRDISSLTKIISGGAPIPPRVVEEYQSGTGTYIYNGYGLTEGVGPTHQVPVSRSAPVDPNSGALAIGVPIPHTESKIMNDGVEAPIGEYGEIWLRGPQVISGYWNKPEETAHAIVDGWLRTGDIGFMDEDGWFYLVDRLKDQINASGFKVWPREVEDVLYEHPAVREAAVVGVPDSYRGETVKAVISLKQDAVVTADEIVEFCKSRMAAYKYPRIVEFVDDIPKNASGKILRRELRDAAKTQ
jgi:long-chain acyl-CoA synthetase